MYLYGGPSLQFYMHQHFHKKMASVVVKSFVYLRMGLTLNFNIFSLVFFLCSTQKATFHLDGSFEEEEKKRSPTLDHRSIFHE